MSGDATEQDLIERAVLEIESKMTPLRILLMDFYEVRGMKQWVTKMRNGREFDELKARAAFHVHQGQAFSIDSNGQYFDIFVFYPDDLAIERWQPESVERFIPQISGLDSSRDESSPLT